MESTTFWRLALVVVLLCIAGVQYKKNAAFRGFVNDKCPWIKEQLANCNITFDEPPATDANAQGASTSGTGAATSSLQSTPPSSNPVTAGTPAVVLRPATLADLPVIAANPALWPKTIHLKKQTIFPAVLQGKEVGKITPPAGAEVRLTLVKENKLAVAYSPDGSTANAGAVWVDVQDTDILERVRMPK